MLYEPMGTEAEQEMWKMHTMSVTCEQHTSLAVCALAIRTIKDKFKGMDNGGPNDKDLIYRVGNASKHGSVLEHLVYTFSVQGVSRALLQELMRHRISSPSVKSTRYTLTELMKEPPIDVHDYEQVGKYCVLTCNNACNFAIGMALRHLQEILHFESNLDIAKFALPESYKTSLFWTINARSLQNVFNLRSSRAAMWEIRLLAVNLFNNLPEDHKYLFEDGILIQEAQCR